MADDIGITIQAGNRQAWGGFGVSQVAYSGPDQDVYKLTPPDKLREMEDMIYRDLQVQVLRMWMGPGSDPTFYRTKVWPGAAERKVPHILVSPGTGEARPADAAAYGTQLGDWIKKARDGGLPITVTGINNEPSLNWVNDPRGWRTNDTIARILATRASLDGHELADVSIVAPEGANTDDWQLAHTKAMKADARAWAAVRGVASHSYSYSLTERHAQVVAGTGKEYWMTEASENGRENAGNDQLAYSTIARFLNDVNHYATHWIWFIGFYRSESDDDSRTKLINYQPATGQIEIWPKYHYLKHLINDLELGASFRHCTRDHVSTPNEQEMNRQQPYFSTINVAAALNPNGSWVIGLTAAAAHRVTISAPELVSSGPLDFHVRRTRLNSWDQADGTVTMTNGQVVVSLAARELVTLVSPAHKPPSQTTPNSPSLEKNTHL